MKKEEKIIVGLQFQIPMPKDGFFGDLATAITRCIMRFVRLQTLVGKCATYYDRILF